MSVQLFLILLFYANGPILHTKWLLRKEILINNTSFKKINIKTCKFHERWLHFNFIAANFLDEKISTIYKKAISSERKLIFVHGNINGIKAISKRLLKKEQRSKMANKVFCFWEMDYWFAKTDKSFFKRNKTCLKGFYVPLSEVNLR